MLLGSGGGAASGAAIAIVDTAGTGGFFTPTVFVPEDAAPGGVFASSGNQVRVSQFVLPFRTTVGKATVEVTTLQAATVATVGIYDSSGTKLIDSGTFDVSSTGFKQNSFTAVTLQPGTYYAAWSADGTTAAGRHLTSGLGSAAGSFVNQGTASRRATAANAMAGGVLPSTLGALADTNLASGLIAYWET